MQRDTCKKLLLLLLVKKERIDVDPLAHAARPVPSFLFMTTTVLDFCTPPVPGERHKYYGDVHNKFIKLPINPPAPAQQPPPPVKHVAPATLKRQKTLHAIAASGNLALFKQILALHPNAANEMQASTGLRPIHFAASRGNHEIVRCLIEEYGADVDIRDHEGEVSSPYPKVDYSHRYLHKSNAIRHPY